MLSISTVPRGAQLKQEIAKSELTHGCIIALRLSIIYSSNAIAGNHKILTIVFLDKFILIIQIIFK